MEKYTLEQHNLNYNGAIFTIKNLTPNIHSGDREERKRKIEECLYSVFRKYIKPKS